MARCIQMNFLVLGVLCLAVAGCHVFEIPALRQGSTSHQQPSRTEELPRVSQFYAQSPCGEGTPCAEIRKWISTDGSPHPFPGHSFLKIARLADSDLEYIEVWAKPQVEKGWAISRRSSRFEVISEKAHERLETLSQQLAPTTADPPLNFAIGIRVSESGPHGSRWTGRIYDSRDLPPEVVEILTILGEDWSARDRSSI